MANGLRGHGTMQASLESHARTDLWACRITSHLDAYRLLIQANPIVAGVATTGSVFAEGFFIARLVGPTRGLRAAILRFQRYREGRKTSS